MLSPIPDEWKCSPPESLVVGSGPYAPALAAILGNDLLFLDQLQSDPQPDLDGNYPRVLNNVKRVFLVVPETMSPAETLQCHQSVWNWIAKLSAMGDQHDLAFIFVLPVSATREHEDVLAMGLCVPSIDPATTGHGVWRQSGSLSELLDLAGAIRPMDAVSWSARRQSDQKRLAIIQLCQAATTANNEALDLAARKVRTAFLEKEYFLDLFCNSPSHRHGNLLRCWLNGGVTDPVTQDWCTTGRECLKQWLDADKLSR